MFCYPYINGSFQISRWITERQTLRKTKGKLRTYLQIIGRFQEKKRYKYYRRTCKMTTEEEYKDACNEFMSLQPSIMEQKAKLNALKKEQKQYIKVIRQYMVDNDLTSVDVGGYEFNREEVEKCAYSEKNFVEFLQNMRRGGKILEEYKETYTQSGEKFKMNRPKKRKVDEV